MIRHVSTNMLMYYYHLICHMVGHLSGHVMYGVCLPFHVPPLAMAASSPLGSSFPFFRCGFSSASLVTFPFSCSMLSSTDSWLLSLKAVVLGCSTSFSWGWLFSSAILFSTWACVSASLVPSLGVNPRSRLALNRPCMGVPSSRSSVYELRPLLSTLWGGDHLGRSLRSVLRV